MSRYLVVANQTVTNPKLITELKAVAELDPPAEFVLLVPATPVRYLLFRRGTEQGAEAAARKRVDRARTLFAKRGINLADAHVGPAAPMEAIDEEMRACPGYAGVVISTLPGGDSRWLQMNLPQAVESRHEVPVFHVEAPPAWSIGL